MFGMFHPAASHIVPCLDPIDSSSLAALAHSFDFGTCFPAVADVLLFHSFVPLTFQVGLFYFDIVVLNLHKKLLIRAAAFPFVFLFLQNTLPLQLKTELFRSLHLLSDLMALVLFHFILIVVFTKLTLFAFL